MLIKVRKGWEIPERMATKEEFVFNRRGLFKAAGAIAVTGALAACGRSDNAQAPGGPRSAAVPEPPDPTVALYPAKRNPAYTLDREITLEKIVTSYNNYYEFGVEKDDPYYYADRLPIRPWEISFEGAVEKPFKTDFDSMIKEMPLEERLYRHRCVETWAFAAPWSGFPMKALIDFAKPTSSAKYVVMKSWENTQVAPAQNQIWVPWPYTEGLTIEEATNEMAFIVTGAYGKPLAKTNGAPLRLVTPWKYGFKSAKGIQRFIFQEERPQTYWMALGPTEYGFWANVNPAVPHPRWSQASEEILGTGERVPTQIFNGYGEQVASLYTNMAGERLFM
ncbi:MAG TPA: protein-methionine-sulfoxide reductase catalytic subunit MsrP [Micropepsaceae bacterium]|nr:protein-methionine-sulfoxide reductase catalytic subunit MsrP [Micropepsaceae bacterium]